MSCDGYSDVLTALFWEHCWQVAFSCQLLLGGLDADGAGWGLGRLTRRLQRRVQRPGPP